MIQTNGTKVVLQKLVSLQSNGVKKFLSSHCHDSFKVQSEANYFIYCPRGQLTDTLTL